ncbi:hypothetical protein PHMEG_0008882 [Phytophthora megakarya]|uniref:Uncharacterized protein n=1 Tax=Phytophthora megakarya TaxID=4795 RepID=A0A225WJB1_9STRA|nr:hypothetical protein PHMEG_0008882 [Phytophthora megakarya]
MWKRTKFTIRITECVTKTPTSYVPPPLRELAPEELLKQDTSDIRDDYVLRLIEMLPPMYDDSRLDCHDFDFMVSSLVLLLNEHWWTHTGSCFKASRVTSSPTVCRYSFPRDVVHATYFRSGGVELRRLPGHEYINGFNPVMMAAFKSNHYVQVLLGEKDVASRIYYCCKYVTKTQNQVDSVAAVALAAFWRREENEQEESDLRGEHADRIRRSRKRVAAMSYNLSNRQEMAGPLAALYIWRGSCSYTSAPCKKLMLYSIFALLFSDEEYSCDLIATPMTRDDCGGSLYKTVSALDDYIFRPLQQENVNLYKFFMKYFRRKRTKLHRRVCCFILHIHFSTHTVLESICVRLSQL